MKTKSKPSFLKVAYVSKAHGIKGEIFVRLFNVKADWPHPIREIFIGDSYSAFSVKNHSRHKQGIIFELEGCQSRQEAESLKGQPVFLPVKKFKSQKGEEIYLAELTSFCVEIVNQGEIGQIQSFKSDKFQDFLCVTNNKLNTEILIPFTESYIKDINFSKRRLILDLPKDFLKLFSGPNHRN